jgi:hypothetical protein
MPKVSYISVELLDHLTFELSQLHLALLPELYCRASSKIPRFSQDPSVRSQPALATTHLQALDTFCSYLACFHFTCHRPVLLALFLEQQSAHISRFRILSNSSLWYGSAYLHHMPPSQGEQSLRTGPNTRPNTRLNPILHSRPNCTTFREHF